MTRKDDELELAVERTFQDWMKTSRVWGCHFGSEEAFDMLVLTMLNVIGPPRSPLRKAFAAHLRARDEQHLDAERYRKAMLED